MRLAVISSPRSGNNWLQHLLSSAYDLPRVSADTLPQVDWAALPRRCVLMLHWPRKPELLARLRQHNFQVVVLARHPCDLLISILQFCLHSDPDRWLEGEGGNERAIVGALPTSSAFLDYATGPRAAALLSVSRQWWSAPDVLQVRYEDLVAGPDAELTRLIDALGVEPRCSIADAVAANTLTNLRRQHAAVQHHFWRGQAGTWKTVLPAAHARRIAAAHADLLSELGYECDADATLDERQAELNWYQCTWARLVEDLQATRGRLAVARARRRPSAERYPPAGALISRLRQWAARLSSFPDWNRDSLAQPRD